ncbi:hypothetical protein [Cryobacterium sp. PH31-O1]|uniref:hypothetical protein n=1 Tax=Cryobacterium sp. PH31-O1 TaxID=3046306 RepID=UPI0024BAE4CA|nr:hypothetical protein [Cryobacterium sp. PH31-O1]MDJ0339480.1 hypothetical protein [Cryobacterium sp. PH31-O1]
METAKNRSNPVYGDRMQTSPRRRPTHSAVRSAAALFLAVGALSGCSAVPAPAPTDSAAPVPAATSAPTETPPIFASNEEALAAAKAAYSNYLAAGDTAGEIGSDSWIGFLALSTGTEHDATVQSKELMKERGWSFIGVTRFDSMTVQSSRPLADSTWEIRTYLCLDLRDTDTVNEAGDSVVKENGSLRSPMVVVFVTANANSNQLLISESPIWSGSDFCS